MITALFSLAFCLIGIFGGWFVAEKYFQFIIATQEDPHDFEHLFEKNPHPEIFENDGTINRGDYIYVQFPPGFDPEDMSSYSIEELDEEEDF